MSEVTFDKGVVTYTFLVTTSAAALRADLLARYPNEMDTVPDEDKPFVQEYLEDPQQLAEGAVSDLFHGVIENIRNEQAWPQGSVVQIGFVGKEADAARLAPVRQKVENGELSGQLVTARLGILRENKPFPGLAWLTRRVEDAPKNGMVLLYTEAVQLLA